MIVDVVVRCRNEMPHTRRTLEALASQRRLAARVLFMDCASTDGSREAASAAGCRIIDGSPESYMPGEVLNRAMALTTSELVAFVNADAVPLADDTLALLLAPLARDAGLAATYGRQLARPGASRLTRAEYARAFGAAGPLRVRLGPFFSMAGSALRRGAWEALRFDERLRYSEDLDFVRRATAVGWRIAYVPAARFEHSHDYDLAGYYRRRLGEGRADTDIFHLGSPSWYGDLARPLLGALARDAAAGVFSPAARALQAAAYFAGRRRGGFTR